MESEKTELNSLILQNQIRISQTLEIFEKQDLDLLETAKARIEKRLGEILPLPEDQKRLTQLLEAFSLCLRSQLCVTKAAHLLESISPSGEGAA